MVQADLVHSEESLLPGARDHLRSRVHHKAKDLAARIYRARETDCWEGVPEEFRPDYDGTTVDSPYLLGDEEQAEFQRAQRAIHLRAGHFAYELRMATEGSQPRSKARPRNPSGSYGRATDAEPYPGW